MNYKMILSIIGKTLIAEGILLLLPMLVGVIYSENNLIAFLIPSLIALSLGVAFNFIKSKDKSIYHLYRVKIQSISLYKT